MIKKVSSYFLAMCLSLLAIAPPMGFKIPMMVNTSFWCFLVVTSGFLGFLICFTRIHLALKILSVYLFLNCFVSQTPFLSFNAYILIAVSLYFFIIFQEAEQDIVLKFLQAVFWFEATLAILQLFGMDKLLNFGAGMALDESGKIIKIYLDEIGKPVFLGTVMQYMRFSSFLAVLSVFLLLRSRLYLYPIIVLCFLSQSSTFALSIAAWFLVYGLLKCESLALRLGVLFSSLFFVGVYAVYDYGSFHGAIDPSNGGRLSSWLVILKTWLFNTAQSPDVVNLTGPFRWDWLLWGHGIDTFLGLFPVYKHDANPFGQAHNCWLQFLWELGSIGTALIVVYCVSLIVRLYRLRKHLHLAGLASIGTNMFFAFPTRMTQTALLIVAYCALCEQEIRNSKKQGGVHV